MVQSFTARMPLLTATSAFRLGRRRWSSPQVLLYLYCLSTNNTAPLKLQPYGAIQICLLLHYYYNINNNHLAASFPGQPG